MTNIVKVKINSAGLAKAIGKDVGDVVDVVCKNGVPKVREWRNRFRDMKIDGCISLVQDEPKVELKKIKPKKEAE